MGRAVDPGRRAAREQAIDSLSIARNDVSLMRAKCSEILSLTQREVGGHPDGEALVAQLSVTIAALARACSRLEAASRATFAIDVTVEVPDPTR